ncbi:unnamed protein product [Brachionus calyciflorus]|uniref:Uncharacterized protein n=1 Tax=Brachionus calyciflorus TaxID=104777 RepID=A0A814IPR7_9BILA|nr:unnamed protein product [Brachionus calyciflorus]
MKNKILELVTGVSAPSLMDLKPSAITNHKIDLIDPQQEPIRQKTQFQSVHLNNEELLSDSLPSYDNYFYELFKFSDPKNLNILHLNVNSVEYKLVNFDDILSANLFDIVAISESKLDNLTSSKFGKGYGYQILRRDRNSHSVGLIIFINSKLKIILSHNSPDFELIHFQI